jgi:hypothetical protein
VIPTWRALGVAGAALTAYVHVAEFGSAWAESHVIAVGFLALAACCAACALVLAVRLVPALWLTMAAACVAAIVGYLVSRTIGLPGMPDDVADWATWPGSAAIASEALVVVSAAAGLGRFR